MKESFQEIVSLDQVNNGAVAEYFDIEFKKLLKNLADEDTSWKAAREIQIKLKVKLTSEVRDTATTTVEVVSKLAPPKPNETIVHLDTDGREVFAFARKEANQPDLDNIHDIEEAR